MLFCVVCSSCLLFTSLINRHQVSAHTSPPLKGHPWSSHLKYVCAPVHCLSPPIQCQLLEGWGFVFLTVPSRKLNWCWAHSKSSGNTCGRRKGKKEKGGRKKLRRVKSVSWGAYSKGAIPQPTQLCCSVNSNSLWLAAYGQKICIANRLWAASSLWGCMLIWFLCGFSPEIPCWWVTYVNTTAIT